VARRRWVLLVVWVAFLADLLVGAGLLLSERAALRTAGLAMIGLAAAVLVGFTLWFYVQNRRRAKT
jgi:hypothetical protein